MATGHTSKLYYGQLWKKKLMQSCYRSSDFETVSKSPIFIDKTMLIREIFKYSHPYVLISAPPGFGKSTNLNMLKRFAEINIDKTTGEIDAEKDSNNGKLFKEPLLISRESFIIDTYLGKFAVIHLSLKDVYGNNMKSLLKEYTKALAVAFRQHEYLLRSDKLEDHEKTIVSKYISTESSRKLSKKQVEVGIVLLANYISKHCENYKIFAFIDDYDDPLLTLIKDKNVSDKYERQFCVFFQNIFRNMLSVNCNINRALITGVTSLGKNLFRSEPSMRICNFFYENCDHPFGEYYGVTEKELDTLLKKFTKDKTIVYVWSKIFITSQFSLFGYVFFKYNIIICTRGLMCFLNDTTERYRVDCLEVAKRIKLLTALPSASIRYLIEKLLLRSSLKTPNFVFKSTSIKILRSFLYTNSKNSSNEAISTYIQLLAEFGICRMQKTTAEYTVISAANETELQIYEKLVMQFYSIKLNNQLNSGAAHLNSLSISSGSDYFSKFAEILKHVYKQQSDEYPNFVQNDIYLPFCNVVAKSEYFIVEESIGLCSALCMRNQVTGISCGISYQSDIKDTLQKTLMLSYMLRFPNKIFMGINFDESFSSSFGLIVNSEDMNNAVYYNF